MGPTMHELDKEIEEGLSVKALYTKEDLPPFAKQGRFLPQKFARKGPWHAWSRVRVTGMEETCQAILEARQADVDGVVLCVENNEDAGWFKERANSLIQEVDLNGFTIVLPPKLAHSFALRSIGEEVAVRSESERNSFQLVIPRRISACFSQLRCPSEDALLKSIKKRSFCLSACSKGKVTKDRERVSSVEQLAGILHDALGLFEYVGERGFSVRATARESILELPLGTDLFLEIAKIRALRRLWTRAC